MSKSWIKKIHQSFNMIDDDFILENLKFYSDYFDHVLSEIDCLNYYDFKSCNENLKSLVEIVKRYSKNHPYLIFTVLEPIGGDRFKKHRFWNEKYFIGEIKYDNLESYSFNGSNCYISILLDLNVFLFLDNKIYIKSLIEIGKFIFEIKNIVNKNGFFCKELEINNYNAITKSLTFNLSEVAYFSSLEIEL